MLEVASSGKATEKAPKQKTEKLDIVPDKASAEKRTNTTKTLREVCSWVIRGISRDS